MNVNQKEDIFSHSRIVWKIMDLRGWVARRKLGRDGDSSSKIQKSHLTSTNLKKDFKQAVAYFRGFLYILLQWVKVPTATKIISP